MISPKLRRKFLLGSSVFLPCRFFLLLQLCSVAKIWSECLCPQIFYYLTIRVTNALTQYFHVRFQSRTLLSITCKPQIWWHESDPHYVHLQDYILSCKVYDSNINCISLNCCCIAVSLCCLVSFCSTYILSFISEFCPCIGAKCSTCCGCGCVSASVRLFVRLSITFISHS